MKKSITGHGSAIISVGFWVGWLVIYTISAAAQNTRNTDYSPDKSLKSSARVNPSTLAMELAVPLGGYPGRAGNSLPVVFNYSSKVWRIEALHSFPHQTIGTVTNTLSVFAERTAGGWSSNLGSPRIDYKFDVYEGSDNPAAQQPPGYVGQVHSIFEPGQSDPQIYNLYSIKRLRVEMPDGSSHEFRADDTIVQCGDTGTNCTGNTPGVYLSVDGSQMRLEINADKTARLYLPGGGYYDFAANAQQAHRSTDAHGNRMTYSIANRQWTDTLGRIVQDPLPSNWNGLQNQTAGDVTASFPGFGGGAATINATFSWRYLKDPNGGESGLTDPNQTLRYAGSSYCQGNGATAVPGDFLFDRQTLQTRVCNNPNAPFNPVVLTKITLANNQSYQFKYNLHGEIEKIVYPSGGYERFAYAYVPPVQIGDATYDQTNRGVVDRWVSESGAGTDEMHWNYAAGRGTALNPAPYKITTVNPDGTRSEQLLHDERNPNAQRPYGFDHAKTGRAYESRVYSAAPTNQLMRRTLTAYAVTGALPGGYAGATRDLRPEKEISIIFEPGATSALATMSETVYDTSGNSDAAYFSALNAKQTKTFHYIVLDLTTAQSGTIETISALFTSANVATVTETDYLYDANYQARNINGLATETRIKDAAGNVKAKSQVSYDEGSYAFASTGALPTAAASSWIDLTQPSQLGAVVGSKRGLATTIKSYSDLAVNANQYIETHTFYDQYGNARKMKDGKGFETEMRYDAAFAFAYPTRTITPIPGGNGSTVAFETTVDYNYNTGLPTSSTDANNLETRMEYNDPLYRPTKVQQYFGGLPVGAASETVYGAGTSATTRYVKTRTQIEETKWKEGFSWYDGLGRGIKSQSVDSNGDVFTKTLYDAVGRVSKTSNPYRGANTADNLLEWTEVQYDTAGRAWKTITPDGAAVQTAFALATTGDTIGTAVTVTDQALKQRRSITNALGQLKRVDEPTDADGLGLINSPKQPTYYAYDMLSNLTTVQQSGTNIIQCGNNITSCSQTRSFVYDSLSRLKSATNPEAGTIQYLYDNNGNLTKKTDARLVETNYGYDALNRVIARSYTNEPTGQTTTPSVAYFYDNLPNAKGKLTKVTTTGTGTNTFTAVTDYQAFDSLGRVTQSQQTIDGTAYGSVPMTYTYNLSGALVEQQYPSGRVVKNVLDAEGDLALVQSKKNGNSGFWNYAKSFTYTAAGAVSSMQLGNGRWESTVFNSRLQPTQIALGGTQNATNLLKLNFAYNTPNSTTDNNGNVVSQTITTPSETHGNTTYPAFVATQAYTYDALNRLKSAEETSPTQPGWRQTYLYDRFGNRNFDTGSDAGGIKTTTLPLNCATAVCNPTVDPNTNKLVGYGFDNAGNTKTDASGKQFTYDSENKQTLVKNGSNVIIGEYFYDGDGKRVKKVALENNQLVTTIFVYDAAGKLVAEYANPITTTTAQVSYLTSDHLVSPRINTDQNGAVISRHDYMPFGEEVTRTGYGTDEVRKQFTSYERDNETGLDFAQARMYAKNHGRFTSPDPLLSSGEIESPQTWNRFVYTLNNPLTFTDPTGLFAWSEELGGEASNDKLEQDRKAADKAKNKDEAKRLKNILNRRESITNALKEARTAAKSLNSKDKGKVEAALNQYGDAGVDNGVTVGVAVSGGDLAGAFTKVEKGQIIVAFTEAQLSEKNKGSLFISVAHEAMHVAGARNWLNAPSGSLISVNNPSRFASEKEAYTVSSQIAQGANRPLLNDSTTGVELWNKAWGVTDSQVIKAREGAVLSQLTELGLYDSKKKLPTTDGNRLAFSGNGTWK